MSRSLADHLTMPLLSKELIELALRKRTYLWRVGFTLIFYVLAFMIFEDVFSHVSHPRNLLGHGLEMLVWLLGLQLAAIYLFLPVMVGGVVTKEKERHSLELLLVTDLRPLELLLQKMAGRMIPMLSLLMATLPLMGVAYSFGGMTPEQLTIASYLLLMTCLQVGALSLMWSTHSSTMPVACMMTYLWLILLNLGPLAVLWLSMGGLNAGIHQQTLDLVMALSPPYLLYQSLQREMPLTQALMWSLPLWSNVGICLLLARIFLRERAMVRPRNQTLRLFQRLDRWFGHNQRGLTVVSDHTTLPDEDPVLWREAHRRSVGRERYLLRLLILLEVPVACAGCWTLIQSIIRFGRGNSEALMSLWIALVWTVLLLVLFVQASSTIATERRQQTLDLLLTTPVRGVEILHQKSILLWRYALLFAVPLVTLVCLETLAEVRMDRISAFLGDDQARLYLICSLLSILIYVPMFLWLALWVGLRVGGQSRAILVMIGVTITWCVGALLAASLVFGYFDLWKMASAQWILLLSTPLWIVLMNEAGQLDWLSMGGYAAIAGSFSWYAMLALLFRWMYYRDADRGLGRIAAADPEF